MQPVRDSLRFVSNTALVRGLVTALPITSAAVQAHVAGEKVDDLVTTVRALHEEGFAVTVDHLGPPTDTEVDARAAVAAYRTIIDRLADAGLARGADVILDLAALGAGLADGERFAFDNARKVARTAVRVGATVTLDGSHDRVEATLRILADLRTEVPAVGVILRAQLLRTQDDCRALAHADSRVVLTKGADDAPADVVHVDRAEIDRAFVRCLKILFAGEGHPTVATPDARLVEITAALASRYGRAPSTYDLQMRSGVRPQEQRRLLADGEQVRVHVAFGPDWYAHLTRRLADRPGDLRFFWSSLIGR